MTQNMQQMDDPAEEAAVMDVEGLLSGELEKVAMAKSQAIEIMISQMQGAGLPQRISGSLDSTYKNLIAPNEVVVARLSPGDKILSQKNQRTVVDPKTNETVIVAPRPEYQAAMTSAPINDKNVVEAAYNRRNPGSGTSFNLQEAMKVLSTLQGEELLSATNAVRTSISIAMAEEQTAIRQQAAIKSGYLEAETNYNLNRQMDRQAGYQSIATAQTNQAQAIMSQALQDSQKLELSLITQSTRLAELAAAKENLNKTEVWRGKLETSAAEQTAEALRKEEVQRARDREKAAQQGAMELLKHERRVDWETDRHVRDRLDKDIFAAEQQIRKLELAGYTGDRADARVRLQHDIKAKAVADKAALLRDRVPDQQLENYRLIYGSSGDDMKDRDYIVQNRNKDKRLGEVVGANDITMYSMLASKDQAIREAAVKLIDGYEKILNAQGTVNAVDIYREKGASEGQTAKSVRKILDLSATPDGLLKFLGEAKIYTSDDVAKFNRGYLQADAKGKENITAQMIRDGVNFVVAANMRSQFVDDVRLWKSSETASGPFKEAIDKVRSKDGKVRIEDAVDAFIIGDYKDANGADMDAATKQGIINRALASAVQNGYRSSLFPARAAEALINEMLGVINTKVNYSRINRFFSGVLPTSYGHYMRDRNAGGATGSPLPVDKPINKPASLPIGSEKPSDFYPQ